MSKSEMRIDLNRLKSLLEGVNSFGFDPETGGYNRPGFSENDRACRNWFADQMRRDGLDVHLDGALNVFGRYGPEHGPTVMTGSHLDTVVNGGAFDGSLGACVALECIRTMRDAGLSPVTALEVVATSEEEGRFGGMLGSQTLTGTVTEEWISQAMDADGHRLSDILRSCGLTPEGIRSSARSAGSVLTFLELHIEQGPILEQESLPIGIADQVSGVCYLELTLEGTANHSGTTPMSMRADAFTGLSQVARCIPDVIENVGTEQSRITIGHVTLTPNQPHTIPGKAVFSVILRDTSEAVMQSLKKTFLEQAQTCAARQGLELDIVQRSWLPPSPLDAELADLLQSTADDLGLTAKRMPSGAGHDAQTMQSICSSGLIFVPSRKGISHAPEEFSAWEDIEKGANLMLHALMKLAMQAPT